MLCSPELNQVWRSQQLPPHLSPDCLGKKGTLPHTYLRNEDNYHQEQARPPL